MIRTTALLVAAAQVSPAVPDDVLTSLSFYQVMTEMIQSNPPPACDRVLLDQFALAGIGISPDETLLLRFRREPQLFYQLDAFPSSCPGA